MELAILDFIQLNLRCGILDGIMTFITGLGDSGKIWIACTILLLLIPRTRKAGAAMGIALALESICCNVILKPFVARIRPCDVNTAVQLLIERPSDYSFPSGHTAASFAAASALYFTWKASQADGSELRSHISDSGHLTEFSFLKKLWIPAGILAGLIAFSRLYLYVHYPTDVLAGALIGIMFGWLGALLANLAQRESKSTQLQKRRKL